MDYHLKFLCHQLSVEEGLDCRLGYTAFAYTSKWFTFSQLLVKVSVIKKHKLKYSSFCFVLILSHV